jgi:hypothetical protein
MYVYMHVYDPELEPEPEPELYSDKMSEPEPSSNFQVPQPWFHDSLGDSSVVNVSGGLDYLW